ncbi:heme anaerobic degradation radical SAM methyltransferase ChuW/HutW [Aliagarivorans taiwanensis]|uniref:heme anaerobic degradation radical SAM methyltransferase ChuW/HutW n=1 Tax=Aliagarivorans taiwanensis TaxID=561966 RepID=UPI00042819B8|nr:heme anaerobic degradation radical SAM methyltransferase ChuW/HutW [Aliagarivorans taiwanensis]
MELQIDIGDEALVGRSTPDPLRYAFSKKRAAHAGGRSAMVAADKVQSSLTNALNGAASGRPRCLYVHIPFCRVRCSYCNFFQYASSKALMARYFDALMSELRWKAAMPWTQAAPFQAVYIGGGTPTDLSAEQLTQLGKTLRELFPLTPDCEITLEGRVNRFGADKFEAALEGGFNRFSFGVQSFNTQVRRSAKRLDDREVVLERLQSYRAYQAAPIVVDLLYGLPHQDEQVWLQDLQDYLDVGVDGVDLYQLIEMQGLPMQTLVEQGKLPEPADTATKAGMFAMGVEFMARHFQRRLSCNHWASGNRERSIYNSLAKTSAEILPFGAGGGGNVAGLQMMQSRDIDCYIEAVEQQQFAVPMLSRASHDAALFGAIKAGFDRGVLSQRALDQQAGYRLFEQLSPLFSAWQGNGLVSLSEGYLSLTTAGQFWNVTLSQNLIGLLQAQPAATLQQAG